MVTTVSESEHFGRLDPAEPRGDGPANDASHPGGGTDAYRRATVADTPLHVIEPTPEDKDEAAHATVAHQEIRSPAENEHRQLNGRGSGHRSDHVSDTLGSHESIGRPPDAQRGVPGQRLPESHPLPEAGSQGSLHAPYTTLAGRLTSPRRTSGF